MTPETKKPLSLQVSFSTTQGMQARPTVTIQGDTLEEIEKKAFEIAHKDPESYTFSIVAKHLNRGYHYSALQGHRVMSTDLKTGRTLSWD